MQTLVQQLADNVRAIRDRIDAAADRVGRDPGEVTLVAVSKSVDANMTRDLVHAGCADLGENRPQAFWPKAQSLADLKINWHFVGKLQRNKLRRTLPLVSLLHSVDTLQLLQGIERIAADADLPEVNVLLEVNVSGDDAKLGFTEASCLQALEAANSLPHVQIRGLMCMAGLGSGADGSRRAFAGLRTLRDRLRDETKLELRELSMGMSGDFEIAIEEGATIVRVGSLLFENLGAECSP